MERACQTEDIEPEVKYVDKLVYVDKILPVPVEKIMTELERRVEEWMQASKVPPGSMNALLRPTLECVEAVLHWAYPPRGTGASEAATAPPKPTPDVPAAPSTSKAVATPLALGMPTLPPMAATPPTTSLPPHAVTGPQMPLNPHPVHPPPPDMSPTIPSCYSKQRSEVVKAIQWGLRACLTSPSSFFADRFRAKGVASGIVNARVSYEHYERMVEAHYGFRFVGWPEGETMTAPSNLGTGGSQTVRRLWEGLRSGKCGWEKIPDAEREELRKKYPVARTWNSAGKTGSLNEANSGRRKRTDEEEQTRPAKIAKLV